MHQFIKTSESCKSNNRSVRKGRSFLWTREPDFYKKKGELRGIVTGGAAQFVRGNYTLF